MKYMRVGHLFQDRFKSEPVETDEYLLTVVRYIHQNPLKAGICDDLNDYEYSSYHEYVKDGDFVDTDLIFEYISKDRFKEFCNLENNDSCLDISKEIKFRATDEVVKRLMYKHCRCDNASDFQTLERHKQEKCVKIFYEKGASIRQISRLTGVSKKLVENFLKL